MCVRPQGPKRGRKVKNEVVAEKVVNFSLPENLDVANVKDIEDIQERLGRWRIQCRQRETKMNDMVNEITYIKTYVICL